MPTVDLGSRAAANEIRDDPELSNHLTGRFDRRYSSVEVSDDAPEDVLNEIQDRAVASRSEGSGGSGQVELTDREKRKIDFTETNVPHARSVKAIALDKGVSNWLDYYDTELSVDDHRSVYDRAEGDRRLDNQEKTEDEIEAAAASAHERAQGANVKRAIEACEDKDTDACEFLREQGFSDEEIAAIMGETGEESDLSNAQLAALGRAWDGYREALKETKQHAAKINAIRADAGQDPIEFIALGNEVVTHETIENETEDGSGAN